MRPDRHENNARRVTLFSGDEKKQDRCCPLFDEATPCRCVGHTKLFAAVFMIEAPTALTTPI